MHYHSRQMRVLLLVFSALFVCAAWFVQAWRGLPLTPVYLVSGSYRSELLPDTVTIYDIESIVASAQFQGAIGATASVTLMPDDVRAFILTVRHRDQLLAEDAFAQALQLLRLKLKSLAVAEVEASRSYVEELTEEARRLHLPSAEQAATTSPAGLTATGKDQQRRLLLTREVKDLEAFLASGGRPSWLSAKLDRATIDKAESKVEAERAKLLRLNAIWQPGSEVVREQARRLEKARAALKGLEKHLARVMLASAKQELRSLPAKTPVATEPQPKPASQQAGGEADEELEPTAWLQERSRQLAEKGKQLEQRAIIKKIEGPTTRSEQGSGYWIVTLCWLGAVFSLLGALFVGPSPRKKSLKKGDRRARSLPHRETVPGSPAAPSVPSLQQPEQFFQAFRQRLEQAGGPFPSRILVLGGSRNQERSSLSLRLAQNFSAAGYGVRLIDFDLQERLLSQRIGDETSVGVGDLLAHAGPVEEFFASVPGTSIQFAPAGTLRVVREPVCQSTLSKLLDMPRGGITLIDASFSSPLHVLVGQVDVVLCLTQPGQRWNDQEEQVLVAFREARLPIWGITLGDSQLFRFL